MKILSAILFLVSLQASAISEPPQLLRACINSKDSIVTVSWKPPTDDCGSFTHYCLYASYNGGPFTKVATIPNLSISEYPHKINNSSTKWQYFIRIFNLCNGVDSSQSATLDIDIIRPQETPLDSVSYDLSTQNIIAGWSKNPSLDTKAYKIYNFSSGNGDSIGLTNTTNYVVSMKPATLFPVVIAALDSCNLSSILSSAHMAMYINGSVDTCQKEISLNWSLYEGWSQIDSQSVFLSINGKPFAKDTTLSGSIKSFIYSNIRLGDNFTFYVRAYTKSGTVSSTSNQVSFMTRELKPPVNLYLSNVSVNGNHIEVDFKVTELNDVASFGLTRGLSSTNLSTLQNIESNPSVVDYMYVDMNADPSNIIYYYQIVTYNKCGDTLTLSNASTNILLRLGDALDHNPYIGWIEGVSEYSLNQQPLNSFTWNTILRSFDPIYITIYVDSAGCYQILAQEKNNQIFNYQSTSYSNTVCVDQGFEPYIVNAVSTSGGNNRFMITGHGINQEKSNYQIYNRWGELLVDNPINIPWYLDYKGDFVPIGSYVYVINFITTSNEKRTEKGLLHVIR